jgi:hypothetical protein
MAPDRSYVRLSKSPELLDRLVTYYVCFICQVSDSHSVDRLVSLRVHLHALTLPYYLTAKQPIELYVPSQVQPGSQVILNELSASSWPIYLPMLRYPTALNNPTTRSISAFLPWTVTTDFFSPSKTKKRPPITELEAKQDSGSLSNKKQKAPENIRETIQAALKDWKKAGFPPGCDIVFSEKVRRQGSRAEWHRYQCNVDQIKEEKSGSLVCF